MSTTITVQHTATKKVTITAMRVAMMLTVTADAATAPVVAVAAIKAPSLFCGFWLSSVAIGIQRKLVANRSSALNIIH